MRQSAPATTVTLKRTEQPKVVDRQRLANATELFEAMQTLPMERDDT
jgi:hypothetical protein